MKKNKKMFAILTLVAFMMTLVPALAFAGAAADAEVTALAFAALDGGKVTVTPTAASFATGDKLTIYEVDNVTDKKVVTKVYESVTDTSQTYLTVDASVFKKNSIYTAVANSSADKAAGTVMTYGVAYALGADDFARVNTVAKAASGVYAKTTSADANSTDELEYEIELIGADGQPATNLNSAKLNIWVERTDKVVSDIDTITVTNALQSVNTPATVAPSGVGYVVLDGTTAGQLLPADGVIKVTLKSSQAGKVTVKASIDANSPSFDVERNLLSANGSVTGEFSAKSTSASQIPYTVSKTVTANGATTTTDTGVTDDTQTAKGVPANSIDKYTVTATVKTSDGQPVKDQKVTISVNKSGADLEKEEAKTDNRGKVEFDVTATKSGVFVVSIVAGSASADVNLQFGSTTAINAEMVKSPSTTVAVDSEVTFKVAAKDVYGNKVGSPNAPADQFKSAKAKLGDKEYNVDFDTIDSNADHVFKFTPSKVGNYTVTFQLDNGKKATTTLEVAEQGKIVEMQVNYDADTVNLGATTNAPEVIQIDAAGVTKTATSANIKYAITGKGVVTFSDRTGILGVSAEDKYAGEVLTVTAVDKTSNIAATTTLTIAAGAQSLAFNGSTGVTGQDANIPFSVVDANGNKVALSTGVTGDIVATAVVTSKPEGANATAVVNKYNDLKDKGVAYLQVNSNKDGEVKVQVMIKAAYPAIGSVAAHDEYYTGIATVTFGDKATVEGANSTATMIIGSTTFVANGKVVTSDVAPFVKDGRTFLPIRALGEALGAEVSFDEATNVVTIKLDGKTVTMTLGSAVMTVGDKVVTMDTAAYATAEGRTVVPVRFAAEALGFNVEAVYATDGTTSAVNFSK